MGLGKVGPFGRVLRRADVLKILEHRPPFLFVDHARDNVPGRSIIGVLERRTPGSPAVGRSEVLEGLAQTGCLIVRQCPQFNPMALPVLVRLEGVSWSAEATFPTERAIDFEAHLGRTVGTRFGTVNGKARIANGAELCQARLWFSFLPLSPTAV